MISQKGNMLFIWLLLFFFYFHFWNGCFDSIRSKQVDLFQVERTFHSAANLSSCTHLTTQWGALVQESASLNIIEAQ